ncbi:MAG: hypothetical protein HY592_02060 [Candidatus Omnitrophica bacterium]|nr:hypothetical protein [Candidatus Omnitrophota bacterium]
MKLPLLAKIRESFSSVSSRLEGFWAILHRLSPRERKLATGAAVAVFFLVLNFGIIGPIRGSLQGLHKKILLEEKKAMQNIASGAQKNQIDGIYLKLLEMVNAANMDDEEVRSAMLKDVEEFARGNNIYLSEVKPQISAEKENHKEFYIRMQAEGAPENLVKFLAEFVKTKNLYYVDNIRITPHGESPNKIKATVALTRAVVQTGT